MYQPSTEIRIGTVPWNPNYKHVRWYPNLNAQTTGISSFMDARRTLSNYTYQRLESAIDVDGNPEQYYNYNYVMFQNENFGTKWFYAFITRAEYKTANTARLHLELDFAQTYMFDYDIKPCLVEREHVNDDRIGLHVKNEGIDPGSLKVQHVFTDVEGSFATVVGSTVEPLTDGTYHNNEGDVYGKVYSGASLSVFAGVGGHNALQDFKNFMLALSNNGQQDAVSAAYMVPLWMTSWGGTSRITDKTDGFGFWLRNGADSVAASDDYTFSLPFDSCDGYVPKNAKLFTYPFCKLVANSVSDQQEYACEYFSNAYGKTIGSNAIVQFAKRAAWESDACEFYYPLAYNGVANYYDGIVKMPTWPSVGWVYQSFNNMYNGGLSDKISAALQNAQQSYATTQSNAQWSFLGSALGGAATGAAGGAMLSGVGAIPGAVAGGVAGLVGGTASTVNSLASNDTSRDIALRNANTQIAVAALSPNTAKGTLNSSASAVNSSMYSMWFRVLRPRAEVAKIIDDFFSVFGYSINEVKQPNVTGRASWNYVKTSAANVSGTVPATYLALFNRLLDSGVTFWHTDDVGNYSLSNAII